MPVNIENIRVGQTISLIYWGYDRMIVVDKIEDDSICGYSLRDRLDYAHLYKCGIYMSTIEVLAHENEKCVRVGHFLNLRSLNIDLSNLLPSQIIDAFKAIFHGAENIRYYPKYKIIVATNIPDLYCGGK